MSDEKRTVQERLLRAFESSDLSLVPDERKDADHLIALGLAEAGMGPGSDVLRLRSSGSMTEFKKALRTLVGMVEVLNARRNWNLRPDRVRRVAELALGHYVFPTCQACHGRAYEVEEGAPVLSGRICHACGGTGKRPIQRRNRDEIRDVLEVLEKISDSTERAVRRLLR